MCLAIYVCESANKRGLGIRRSGDCVLKWGSCVVRVDKDAVRPRVPARSVAAQQQSSLCQRCDKNINIICQEFVNNADNNKTVNNADNNMLQTNMMTILTLNKAWQCQNNTKHSLHQNDSSIKNNTMNKKTTGQRQHQAKGIRKVYLCFLMGMSLW